MYFYDAFGRRIAKSSSVKKSSKLGLKGNVPRFGFVSYEKPQRQTMLMLWDGNRQIQEYTTDHVFTTVYEQDSFVPVARLVWLQPHLQEQAKIAEDKQWQELENYVIPKRQKERLEHQTQVGIRIYHYHNDHLGTPQELTNSLGEVVWLNYSQAWGGSYETKCFAKELDNLDVSADLLQPIRFQGQFFDSETNLHYNRFRYYDSDVGMFVSRDPIGLLGGFNVFQYALNPTEWIDPFGLKRRKRKKNPAKSQIQQIEKEEGACNVHGLRRHGEGTTLEQQKHRAKTGITPDGHQGKPIDASRFISQEAHLESIKKAKQIYAKNPSQKSFVFDMGEIVAEGYEKGGKGPLIRTSLVKATFDRKTGEFVSIFGKLRCDDD